MNEVIEMAVGGVDDAGAFLQHSIKEWDPEKVAEVLFELKANACHFAVSVQIPSEDIEQLFRTTIHIPDDDDKVRSAENKYNLTQTVEYLIQHLREDTVKCFLDAVNFIYSPTRRRRVASIKQKTVNSEKDFGATTNEYDSDDPFDSLMALSESLPKISSSSPAMRNCCCKHILSLLEKNPKCFHKEGADSDS